MVEPFDRLEPVGGGIRGNDLHLELYRSEGVRIRRKHQTYFIAEMEFVHSFIPLRCQYGHVTTETSMAGSSTSE